MVVSVVDLVVVVIVVVKVVVVHVVVVVAEVVEVVEVGVVEAEVGVVEAEVVAVEHSLIKIITLSSETSFTLKFIFKLYNIFPSIFYVLVPSLLIEYPSQYQYFLI